MTHQSDKVAGLFERLDGGRMRHVDYRYVVDFQYDVVDLESAVDGRRTTWNDFRQADGRVVADVRVIRTAGDAETQTGAATFQYDLLVFPGRFVASVRLTS